MSFTVYQPSGALKDFIVAYWVRKTDRREKDSGRRVYADGCADLILNTGDSTAFFSPMVRMDQSLPLFPGRLYLGGTMTAYGVVKSTAGCTLTGIRFQPGGFYALYRMPMESAVDRVLEFPDPELSSLMKREEGLATRLDDYFNSKKINSRHDFAAIYKAVYLSKGQITVEELAGSCHVSNRTLERIFKENVGIPPKEFIRIVRFQEVLKRLRQMGAQGVAQNGSEESLLRIAFELGYYDHAHLTHEFSKYAGILPSELSHFYKTGITGGNYF